ncbi:alginate O-acetyltransferase AlgX-related protein [Loktanella sp. Alg231-35]|uniref:alginate O-acetyltransferase AlgX-related protein n=1 Tax=Loktanella sp. Alg231-35 TaxID=1922220 RepID=UPI000D54AF53|nr:hypothetical protein [Loktanella sp. Alg231-35]
MTLFTPANVIIGATYIACHSMALEAAPLCPELLIAEALEPKYQRLAPIHSDTESGWIFTSDQMSETYELKAEAVHLMSQIVSEFEHRGVTLALMIAPPRPLVAGGDVLSQTLTENDAFDAANAAASFNTMIGQLRETGAVVPNLLSAATQVDTGVPFYFRRDTHWTPAGAAASALALAKELGFEEGVFDISAILSSDIYEEKGSLNAISKAVCNVDNPPEPTPILDFSAVTATQGLGLLDEISGASIALVGTSFSDRNQRDQYQVADALAASTGAEIFNYSVSGGGMIGPMEAFVSSDDLATAGHQTVIWEFPYTQSPNSTSQLRQLLGALRADTAGVSPIASVGMTSSDTVNVDLSSSPIDANLLSIETGTSELLKLDVEITFENGTTKTVKLRRKNRIPLERRSSDWWVDLSGWNYGAIIEISLKLDRDAVDPEIQISYLR